MKAAEFVSDGMTVGIGTGTTARHFIFALAERVNNGLHILGVPTSQASAMQAKEMGIPLTDLNDAGSIDIAFDGADEINSSLDLIKGGGGAMLQEKMVAFAARRFIVMADESKMVGHLGKFPLPVEVVPYGWKKVMQYLMENGCKSVTLRNKNKKVYVTEHQHYILDCRYERITHPVNLNQQLKSIPGIVETGLFLHIAKDALVGYSDGSVSHITRAL